MVKWYITLLSTYDNIARGGIEKHRDGKENACIVEMAATN